jgi:hypothetical protein
MLGLHDGAQMGKSLVTFVVRLCAILAALAIVPWPASFAASERKSVPASAPRLALVIGNADYVKLGQLDNPGKDAQLIAEKLRQLSFDVTEKLDRNLKGMADDVDEFARKIKERGKDASNLFANAAERPQRYRQIQTSFAAVRSPPSSPVLSTPRGSISSSLTSCSA